MTVVEIKMDFFKHDAQAGGFFPNTHANPGFSIEKFLGESGQNYLIEGIRGTGKTHILKMINQKCLETYQEKKILPVYVSLASVHEWVESDVKLFRIHLYANIVTKIINTIEQNKEKISLAGNNKFKKSVKKIAQMFGVNNDENINKIIERIKEVNEKLLNELNYNPESVKSTFGSQSNMTAAATGTVTVPKAASLSTTASAGYSENEQKEYLFVGSSLSHSNAANFLVNFILELKNILNNRYTYLLIDECSEVSKEAQIEIFRLLKLVRGALTDDMHENAAYFCASVYPTPITYYPSKNFGDSFNFDVGHDAIMEYISLDELSDDYLEFYKELTNNRLRELLSDKGYSKYLDILENDKCLILAAYFSNGNVRRYIEILKHAYDNLIQRIGHKQSPTDVEKINTKDIEEALSSIVPNQILASNKLKSEDFDILDNLVTRMNKRNKKNETENKAKIDKDKLPANVYFTVSRSQARRLGNLFMQGAIHDKGKTRVKKYYKEEGLRGPLLMLDLAVAFHDGAIDKNRAAEIFTKDLIKNAKRGYLWCQDISFD
ncbi:hypothetical protein [Bacillus cereus]|uniref:ORC-CDC6 family AAA ATPase n=2 Tax=Bacillus cereus TaxID=1396 RepID=UPI000BEDB9FE|nr:hypothetical protein [Bacillus cereus]PED31645.1 hypothetical protein CON13_14130 [Bacillus cereus]PEE53763.1 hypothetical protein COM80_05265 [Bacillus cereus]PFL95434.1 hypothetical protein COJ35_11575 [Bacillus cereus]PFV63843.1 hypothetical protein COL16_28515 [Bacillus cereus]PGS37955.1 hypothetical protein COC56_08700 [Bacillus cereus]